MSIVDLSSTLVQTGGQQTGGATQPYKCRKRLVIYPHRKTHWAHYCADLRKAACKQDSRQRPVSHFEKTIKQREPTRTEKKRNILKKSVLPRKAKCTGRWIILRPNYICKISSHTSKPLRTKVFLECHVDPLSRIINMHTHQNGSKEFSDYLQQSKHRYATHFGAIFTHWKAWCPASIIEKRQLGRNQTETKISLGVIIN